MLLAQLSDIHLLADPTAELWGHNTTHNLQAVMDALPQWVDVIVVTGDIAEDGAPEAYRRAMALTGDRAAQRRFLAGNHDSPESMRSVVGSMLPVQLLQVSNNWTLALVDSQWVGNEAGRIGLDALAQLRRELAGARTDVALCLHHPPVSPCDNPACGLVDAEDLLAVIHRGPVRLVLSGHVHQEFDTTIDGIRFLGAPSTFRQLRHGGDPHYQDTHGPPAAQLLELLDDGSVVRHLIEAR
ncbi:MAG: metallophosphoesterase family protein [Acidimicrobiia bacterium]